VSQFAGWIITPGIANFVLCHLPVSGSTAVEIVSRCRRQGLFLRDVGGMGRCLSQQVLRIAVKDAATNIRMIAILSQGLGLDAVACSGLDFRHAETIWS
jgi:histidinol-phosphate/aromatic aminotransferase/cobyric acid decarboxylase-like protein